MKLSNNGVAFIKREEGEELTAYLDSVNVWTIGVGHTGKVDGKPVTRGMTITSEKSSELLRSDVQSAESAVNGKVTAPLNQNQFDALVSFVFNIGVSAFSGSTVLKRLNNHEHHSAADAMLMWKRAGNIPDLLLPRRKRERELFLK